MLFTEAVVRSCSVKFQMFLKISQDSHKKRLQHRCFPVNIVKFLRTVFYRTPLVAASPFRNLGSRNLISELELEWLKPAISLKVTRLQGCVSCFLNCTNGSKSREVSHMKFLVCEYVLKVLAENTRSGT